MRTLQNIALLITISLINIYMIEPKDILLAISFSFVIGTFLRDILFDLCQ